MKKRPFLLYISFMLVFTSLILYAVHYLIFRDLHFLEIYILDHLAFLPIEILCVTVIIGSLLEYREKNKRLQKMNMVIGTFYSEVGRELLSLLNSADSKSEAKTSLLKQIVKWSKKDFGNNQKKILHLESKIICDSLNLKSLKESLVTRRDFLLRLMENPNLLEHDSFTGLMQAVFHLLEELQFRTSFDQLPDTDYQHLSGDAKRAYIPLLLQWIDHMAYLRQYYPYLYSLEARTNPFDADASVIISEDSKST